MSVSAVILAAGKSTRMRSKLPKPLHEICGKPMLQYCLDACYDAGCDKAIVIVGHEKEQVIAKFGHDKRIVFVEQEKQLGTGHAALMCKAELQKVTGDVFLLAGDGPLIQAAVLKNLLQKHREAGVAASMATAILADPTGYGRVIRDSNGEFVDIIEQIDCTPEQVKIGEVFPSYYCCKNEDLLYALDRLTNSNKKGEYYLTEIYGILRRAGKKVLAITSVGEDDVLSVNDRNQQGNVDAVMQKRIQQMHRTNGVTIVSSATTYIEEGVQIGQDTIVHPFTHIARDTVIGEDCEIGPFAMVPAGSRIFSATNVGTFALNGAPSGASR